MVHPPPRNSRLVPLRNSKLFTGQLIDFFNDEVVVQLAAAAWGLIIPTGYPGMYEHLWLQAATSIVVLLFFCTLQIVIASCTPKSPRGAAITNFILDVLVWQPRLTWGRLGKRVAEYVFYYAVCAVHSTAAALLVATVLIYALLRIFTIHQLMSMTYGTADSVWKYPIATIELALLQFSAKMVYVAWRFLARGFEPDDLFGSIPAYTECLPNGGGIRLAASVSDKATGALCSWIFLLVICVLIHHTCARLMTLMRLQSQSTLIVARVDKFMWLTAFVFGVGGPDYIWIIVVEWLGEGCIHSKELGVWMMYALSTVLLCFVGSVAHWHNAYCQRMISVQPDQLLCTVWIDFPSGVRLAEVSISSAAEPKQSAYRLDLLVGCRLVKMDGQLVNTEEEVSSLIKKALKKSATSVVLLFGSPVSVMNSLQATLGLTASDLLQRTLNNTYAWPFEYHVTNMARACSETPEGRCLIVGTIAIAMTGWSVLVFVLNRSSWERYLSLHADLTPERRSRVTMSVAHDLMSNTDTESDTRIELSDVWSRRRNPPLS